MSSLVREGNLNVHTVLLFRDRQKKSASQAGAECHRASLFAPGLSAVRAVPIGL